jgi:DNA-binding response OmpR family regulator
MLPSDPKCSILVVDDESNLRRTLSLILERSGYKVTGAASTAQARQFIQTAASSAGNTPYGPYNLIFLDLKMPGEDGLVLLPELRKAYPDMPVIILTAHATLDSAIEAVRQGARDYLIKPIEPDEIVARTRQILEQQKMPGRQQEIVSKIEELFNELHQAMPGANPETVVSRPAAPRVQAVEETGRYMRIGSLTLDLYTRHALLPVPDTMVTQEIAIPPTTFDFLVILARHSPEPVSYESLVGEAQNYNVTRAEARDIVRWQIHELRKALEPDPARPRYIITVRDIGYRLVI